MNPLEGLLAAFESLMMAFVDGTARVGIGPMLAFLVLVFGFRAFGQMTSMNAQRRKEEALMLQRVIDQGKEERDAERQERAQERAVDERFVMLLETLLAEMRVLKDMLTQYLTLRNGDTK